MVVEKVGQNKKTETRQHYQQHRQVMVVLHIIVNGNATAQNKTATQ